jgi:hypothetical protein
LITATFFFMRSRDVLCAEKGAAEEQALKRLVTVSLANRAALSGMSTLQAKPPLSWPQYSQLCVVQQQSATDEAHQ